jgi:ubiquinone/menaquinone biosynthesis C-methylase UbiE
VAARPPSTADVWTSDQRTAELRRSADRTARSTVEETNLLLAAAELEPGLQVLDLACGPGDPTLAIAQRLGPEGRVTGADLSEGAVQVARERAERAGLSNVTFRTARAESLPFPDGSFDRVTCRFGAMFFEDIAHAAREMYRVLVPGGRIALMVWASADQPWYRATVGVILEHIGLRELPPEQAVPFRFASEGPLEGALSDAGFRDVRAETRTVEWKPEGDPEQLRDVWRSGSVFFRPLLERLPDGDRSPAWDEITERLRDFYDGREIRIPQVVRVVTATREAAHASSTRSTREK